MNVISNKLIRILKIEYERTSDNLRSESKALFDYLESEYGNEWKVMSKGSHPTKKGFGWAMIEIEVKQ